MNDREKDKKIAALNKAMAHEARVGILRKMREAETEAKAKSDQEFVGLSPRELKDLLSLPLSNVSYHARELDKLGITKEMANRQVRGARQHFYRIQEWAREPVQSRLDEIA